MTEGEAYWELPTATFLSITSSKGTYTLGKRITFGGGGEIYTIAGDGKGGGKKVLKLASEVKDVTLENCKKEAAIQTTFSTVIVNGRPVCPVLYDSGEIAYKVGAVEKRAFFMVMEWCDGDAFKLLDNKEQPIIDETLLVMYTQIASILKQLQTDFQFNHRDLKPNNVLYVGKGKDRKFLLADFGFSCATIDGTEYKTIIEKRFVADSTCFNKSRDLMQLIFNSQYLFRPKPNNDSVYSLNQRLLEFQHKGKPCKFWDLDDTCGFKTRGEEKNQAHNVYEFLNDPTFNNPNTTPDGLLNAIEQWKTDKNKVLTEAAPAAAGQGTGKGGRRRRTQRKKRRRSTRRNR